MIAHQFHLTPISANIKTGPIATSSTSSDSCPPTCPLMNNGCYGENHPLAHHWRAIDRRARGVELGGFVDAIASIPAGRRWRHNVVGDLPHCDGRIDRRATLVVARAGAKLEGWTYTHHEVAGAAGDHNRRVVRAAIDAGLVVNVSSNSLTHADALARYRLPLVTILPDGGSAKAGVTPDGLRWVRCPAEYGPTTCADCGGRGGALCARADRGFVVAFTAHGARRKAASRVAGGEA